MRFALRQFMGIVLKHVRKHALEATLLLFCVCVRVWCVVRNCLKCCWLYWAWLKRRFWCGKSSFFRKAKSTTSNAMLDFTLKQVTAPGVHHNAKPDWIKPELLRLMVHMPTASVRLLAMTFNRLHLGATGVSVGRSFVYEYRLRCRYEIAAARRAMKARAPVEYALNHTWGLDLTGKQVVTESSNGVVISSNHYILGLIDHGSRLLLALTPLCSKHSWRLAWWVALLVARYGKPKFIKTDNDAVFTSRLFKACLAALGVAHRRTAVMSPWQNGRIERVFGTLKHSLDAMTVPSFAALGRLMTAFRFFYNEVRPHQALGGLTPQEAWDGLSWDDVYAKPCKSVTPFSAWGGELVGFVMRR
jgi:transposase InsO family protein